MINSLFSSGGQLFHRMNIYDEFGAIINQTDTNSVEGAVNLAIHRADLHYQLLEQLPPGNGLGISEPSETWGQKGRFGMVSIGKEIKRRLISETEKFWKGTIGFIFRFQ